MRRFYVSPANIGDQITIHGDEARHIARVLRLQPQEMIIAFDGSGYDYEVKLLSVSSDEVTGTVLSCILNTTEPPVDITLVQSLAKGDKMDFIIQKAVELGVNRIIPIQSDHSVVKLDQKRADGRVRRWNRMAMEACKQCGRSRLPIVEEVSRLALVLKKSPEIPGVFFYEQRKQEKLGDLINQHRQAMLEQGTAIFIGPEGGFSESEARMAQNAGLIMAGLGPRTLRTETASLIALSVLMWELGDLGK